MKKRNLIVALSGMGALAVAVGAVGTAAWYTTEAAAGTASAGSPITGSIGSQTSTGASVGNFVVAVKSNSLSWSPNKVCLSDDSGNTYIDTNGATAGGKVQATGTVNTTGTFGMTVTYQGSTLQDAAAILAAWNVTKAGYTFKVTITDTSSSLDDYIEGSGVKLAAASGNASTTTIDRSTTGLDVPVSGDLLTGNFVNNVLEVANAGSFVAALKGLDDTVQSDSDPYQITLTTVVTAVNP